MAKKKVAPAQEPEATPVPAQEVQQQTPEAPAQPPAQGDHAPTPDQTGGKAPDEPEVPAQEPEATLEPPSDQQEAHLDPAQFADWDDDAIRKLAQDMGLDPAAYADRDALIAAIAEVPVTPGPPEEDPEPQPINADTPLPCKATVTAALAILRRTIGPGTADMLKPVATLKRGTQITIITYQDGHAQLANGLWTNAANLAR